MKNFKNITTIFAIMMMLTFTISLIAVPNANAQYTATNPREMTTFPFVDALPNPAGVGQPVLINRGLVDYLYNVNDGWNITLSVTDPDGKVTNTTSKTWSTGTVGTKMSFMAPGNYTLQAFYNGEDYRYNTEYRRYLPSESDVITLEIVEGYWKPDHPGHSLPTEYWTRPVDSQLREWYTIMGSWLVQKPRNTNLYAPYNDAPETAHILWSTPDDQYLGGLATGELGSISYQHGDAYEGKFYGAIILSGILYYNVAPIYSSGNNARNQTIRAIDLHTGKDLWTKDLTQFGTNARLTRGQIMSFFSENNRGAWSYLWIQNGASGTTWWALDPLSGNHIFTLTNMPTSTVYYGPSGEMLQYTILTNATGSYLRQWNSTLAVTRTTDGSSGGSDAWGSQVNTYGNPNSYDAAQNVTTGSNRGIRGVQFEILLPRNLGTPIHVFPEDRAIFGNVSRAGVTLTAVSLDSENFGYRLFDQRFTAATGDWASFTSITATGTDTQSGWAAFSKDPYIGVFWTKEDRVNHVFSLETGRLLWESEPQMFADSWGGATSNSSPEKVIVDGKLIEGSGSGILYCYNATTGAIDWTYENKDEYMESYHRENWWIVPCFVSDGKIYCGYQVHSSQVPLPRGAPFFAIDIETGNPVWKIDGAFRQLAWGGRAIIGDSIIATIDSYDSQVYAVGKGPIEMTVASSDAVATAGNTVLISGTVMDISPGTQQSNVQFRFSKGVPAVSDESMSEWMLHVYKHFERPKETVGVDVTVFAKSTTGEEINIGTTTSDDSGRYAITWAVPEDATGTWNIYAYFGGSGAYYGSSAKSEMAVLAAPEVLPPEPTPPYGWYIAGAAIAIIAVVIIFGLLILLKKK
ncbi:MAG: PQQ-binding-like beta-propeller repeat protein [Candidatus Bathyarchaeota archaeon]|nr:PQQ-binding-like beta-propeller repeat protein [Candidatus Termiticorpusculum sp.]